MNRPAQIPALFLAILFPLSASAEWKRHTIDDSSRGADGVRVGDINQDGHLDLATGWEEGGEIRIYLNPGPEGSRDRWPQVTVGTVSSPEDAVFADLDGDGRLEVVSSCEGTNRTVYVHWSPDDPVTLLNSESWRTEPIPATQDLEMWMFCVPMDVDQRNGIDLVVGSKGANASISWLRSPANPRRLEDWTLHRLYDAGWIMSLISIDLDDDGDMDVVASDRRPPKAGVLWLEHPGATADTLTSSWREHRIGSEGREVMFIDFIWKRNEVPRVFAALKENDLATLIPEAGVGAVWEGPVQSLKGNFGTAKAVQSGDIDLNGNLDLVYTCEGAEDGRSGVLWIEGASTPENWVPRDISGPEGVKFDRMELLDLDADGDLDVITCEERDNLGVIWYENPTRQ